MSFWMRKQTYFNQCFKGRAFPTVTLGERGQLIAAFDVMFGLSFHFDSTAWKYARSLAQLSVFLSFCHTHTQMKNDSKVWEFSML